MRCINKEAVEQIYSHEIAIADCFKSFSIISSKKFTAPIRSSVNTQNQSLYIMPCAIHEEEKTLLGVKMIPIVPGNRERGLPLIPGKVCVFDELTGTMTAIIDGFIVTFKRTGAVAGASSKIFHPAPAEKVVVFGCGAQGTAGLDSILYVHPEVKQVTCFDNFKASVDNYVKAYKEKKDGRTYIAGENVEEAVRSADIIHCATTSTEALFKGEWVKRGTHVSAIGAYRLDMREIPEDLFGRPDVRVFIDQFQAMREEAGDLVAAIKSGVIKEEAISEFGQVINNEAEGRQNDSQITIIKVVGVSIQDIVTATTILRIAEEKNIGVVVDI